MQFEDFFLDFLDSVGEFDFSTLIKAVAVSTVIFWFFVVFWVWSDSRERSTNMLFSLLSVLLVLPFNVLGLIVYLLIRPKDTIEALFWADLERRYLIHETADLGDCDQCGYQMSPDFKVCPQCATPRKIDCPTCSSVVRTDWKYCPNCSHQLLYRRAPEREITQEIMEKNVEDAREQAIEAVENNRIRYKSSSSTFAKLGKPVLSLILSFGALIDRGIKSIMSVVTSKNENDVNESNQIANQNIYNNSNSFKRKKKKKKRR